MAHWPPYLSLIAAALAGFLVAFHIFRHKRQQKALICPIGFSCDQVIHSEYSSLFGVPLEVLGMMYYGLVAVSYTVLLACPAAAILEFVRVILGLSVFAFFFSIYLTFVQAFRLKQWCTWCLISASFCTIIFLVAAWAAGDKLKVLF